MPQRFFVFCTGGIVLLLASPRCCSSRSGTTTSRPSSSAAFSIHLRLDLGLHPVRQHADGNADDRRNRNRGRSRHRRGPRRLIRTSERGALHAVRHDRSGEHPASEMATIVERVATMEFRPLVSPYRRSVTPTRPSAPGTRSQNAGMKLTSAAGPRGCRSVGHHAVE